VATSSLDAQGFEPLFRLFNIEAKG